MTSSKVEDFLERLQMAVGSYLQSTIRVEGQTCPVCTTPIKGYPWCFRCNELLDNPDLADRAGLLVYAPNGSQGYSDLRNYKIDPVRYKAAGSRVRGLLSAALSLHYSCLNTVSGSPVNKITVVPSSQGRTVLQDIVTRLPEDPSSFTTLDDVDTAVGRVFDPKRYAPRVPDEITGHILLIEDLWVTGFHAQSAAACLKQYGADEVSILTVGRNLDPSWPASKEFIKDVLPNLNYDPRSCPWTAGECP